MGLIHRICLVLCLTLAFTGTLIARSSLEPALTALLGIPSFAPALSRTAHAALLLSPLLVWHSIRDVGSFRLRWTWTVFLMAPVLLLNLWFVMTAPPFPPWRDTACIAWAAMATGVLEELVFRGYAFRRLPLLHPKFVILLSAVVFSLLHFLNLTAKEIGDVVPIVCFALCLGVALGIIRIVSGSLGWCMLLHGLNNAMGDLTAANYLWLYIVLALWSVPMVLVFWLHPRLRPEPPVLTPPVLSCSGSA